MEDPREDFRNRLNRAFKQSLGSWVRLVVGIVVGLYMRIEVLNWFQLFAFSYGLYFVHHLATRILYKQRIHQIGNEVAIMAISKKLGLWDDGITQQVNEYLAYRSFDLSAKELWTLIRGRDW